MLKTIMKKALAGCPPVAEGVMAEKKISAVEYMYPSRRRLRKPKYLSRHTIAKASEKMKHSMQSAAHIIQTGDALRR